MAFNAFGIDLGTNNIKIYDRNEDKVVIEKNMIAVENKNTLFAYGNSAFEMYALHGRPVKEVAEFLSLSENSVYVAKNRCITLLKNIIGNLEKR